MTNFLRVHSQQAAARILSWHSPMRSAASSSMVHDYLHSPVPTPTPTPVPVHAHAHEEDLRSMSYRQTPSTRLYTLLTAALYGQLIADVGSGLGGSLCVCMCMDRLAALRR